MEILKTITTKHRSGSTNLKWKACVHALGKQQQPYYRNMYFHIFFSIDKVVTELYLWWLKQYISYRTIWSLFDVNYTKVSTILNVARRAIVDNVYVKVAGLDPDHDISIVDFVETYGSHVSKRNGDEFTMVKFCFEL